MSKGDKTGRRGSLTPEQRAERFSTGGHDFEESVRRVLAGGPDDKHSEGEDVTEEPDMYRLSEHELQELYEREQARSTDPKFRNTLIPPPDELRQALKRQADR